MRTLRKIGGWDIVTRKRLEQLQQYNEWVPAGRPWFGFRMYWNPAQGGLWIKIRGKESKEWKSEF